MIEHLYIEMYTYMYILNYRQIIINNGFKKHRIKLRIKVNEQR